MDNIRYSEGSQGLEIPKHIVIKGNNTIEDMGDYELEYIMDILIEEKMFDMEITVEDSDDEENEGFMTANELFEIHNVKDRFRERVLAELNVKYR